jgi:hypothetical protein
VVPGAPGRREFLAACAALALPGCSGLAVRTRVGRVASSDPHPDQYLPALDALVATILPFDHPRFPPGTTPEGIRTRLLSLFPLEESADYLRVQRALLLFNATDLFAEALPPLMSEERRQIEERDPRADGWRLVREAVAEDAARWRAWTAGAGSGGGSQDFVALGPGARAGYFGLWARSALSVRRAFYRSARTLVTTTAYSSEPFWAAIGYAGPLVRRT